MTIIEKRFFTFLKDLIKNIRIKIFWNRVNSIKKYIFKEIITVIMMVITAFAVKSS